MNEKLEAIIIWMSIILLMVAILGIPYLLLKSSHDNLRLCGKLINQDVKWNYGISDFNFTVKYADTHNPACCWKNSAFISEEGGLIEQKCFGILNEGARE